MWPTAVVIGLAIFAPLLDEPVDMCPAGIDGPQYACWLLEHPEQLEPDDCYPRVGDGKCTGGTDPPVAPDGP